MLSFGREKNDRPISLINTSQGRGVEEKVNRNHIIVSDCCGQADQWGLAEFVKEANKKIRRKEVAAATWHGW